MYSGSTPGEQSMLLKIGLIYEGIYSWHLFLYAYFEFTSL